MSWLWEFCLQYVSLYWGGKAEAAQVHQSHICLLQQIFSFPLQRAQIPVFYRRYFTLYLKKKICLQIVNSPVCDKLLLPPPWGQLVSTVAQRMKPRESFFLFFLLKEYQTNLIAEKELLNGPTGRTMLCSSTHHLKYLSFWIEILSFSFFLSITYFFKLWKKCVYILCLYLVIMWKSGLQLVLRIYAPLPWPLIYTGGILHLPDNDQHLYFFPINCTFFSLDMRCEKRGASFSNFHPSLHFAPSWIPLSRRGNLWEAVF